MAFDVLAKSHNSSILNNFLKFSFPVVDIVSDNAIFLFCQKKLKQLFILMCVRYSVPLISESTQQIPFIA